MPKELILNASVPDFTPHGAVLVTLLTYPKEMLCDADSNPRNESLVYRVHDSLCAATYRARASVDILWGETPQHIRPNLLMSEFDPSMLKSVERRWRRALAAGQMACIFIEHELTGQLPEGLLESKRPTIESVCVMLSAETRLETPDNFEYRIYRAYLPVIHVLAAFHYVREKVEQNGRGPVTMGHLIADPVFIKAVIRKAGEFEEILPRSRASRIKRESLVRIRLAT